jgi:imidazole glycerol phosphate synthase glutamine amidotransferase subunit
MGWNQLDVRRESRLLRGLDARPFVYFAHSYYVPENALAAATCTYGLPYTAVLEAGNVFGVQFHPEKSGPVGLQIVRNFVAQELVPAGRPLGLALVPAQGGTTNAS